MTKVKFKSHNIMSRILNRGKSQHQNQAGFTLLESIMAIVVVGILMTGIAPMIALSVAARVQARRIDNATQAARSYIDGVRSGAITLPARLSGVNTTDTVTTLNGVAAPTAISSDQGVQIDTEGNGFSTASPNDLVIQPIRNGLADGSTNPDPLLQGFDLVVRVYRADAFNGTSPSALATAASDPTGAQVTGLAFIGTTGARYKPLAVVTADAISSDPSKPTTYTNYTQRIPTTSPW